MESMLWKVSAAVGALLVTAGGCGSAGGLVACVSGAGLGAAAVLVGGLEAGVMEAAVAAAWALAWALSHAERGGGPVAGCGCSWCGT